MNKPLKEIVGPTAVKVLRSIYVYKVNRKKLPYKHGIHKTEVSRILEKVSKHMVYNARLHSHTVNLSKMTFQEKDLEKQVWKELIAEEIEAGKTTQDIADETNQPLTKINGFFI